MSIKAGFDIDFVTGHEYYGNDTFTIGGNQYINEVRGDVILSYGCEDEYGFEFDDLTFKLNDISRKFRGYINHIDNRHIKGRSVIVYTYNTVTGIGTARRTMQIRNFGFDPSDNTFIIRLGYSLFKEKEFVPPLIERSLFVDMPEVTENAKLSINHCYGYYEVPTGSPSATEVLKDCVKSPRVLDTPTGTRDYLVGKVYPAADLTPGGILNRIFKPDGTDISASATMTLHSDGYTYVNYSATTEDYLLVHLVPISNVNFIEIFTAILDDLGLTYDTSKVTTLFDVDKERNYSRFPGSTKADLFRYLINTTVNKVDVVKDICIQSEMEYYIDEDNKIHFRAIKYDALTADHDFTNIQNYESFEADETMQETQIIAESAKNPATGNYESQITYNNDDAQDRSGLIIPKQFNYPLGKYPNAWDNTPAFVPAKFRVLRRRNSVFKVNADVDLDHISQPDGLDVKPLDIISFAHTKAPTATSRIYQVRRITHTLTGTNQKTEFDLYDINDFTNYYTGMLTLIHSNDENNSKQFINSSLINSQAYLAAVAGNARHRSTQKVFGISSIRLNAGGDDYITGDTVASPRIEPFQYPGYVMQSWIYRDVAGTGHTIMAGELDANNYWRFQARGDNKLQYHFQYGGVPIINLSGGTLNATTWYHCLFCKHGDNYGLYLAGNQVAFFTGSIAPKNMIAQLKIGVRAASTNPMDGYVDEIAIMRDNLVGFKVGNLQPNVGLTDTFTPPTKPFTDYGLA